MSITLSPANKGEFMARETKQERIVRGITDQVSEHLHELKGLAANPNVKELDIERWCQSVMKNCLGYTAVNGYSILAQESRGKMRPDLIVSKDGKPIFVVEVKKLGYDLSKSDLRSGKVQLAEYLNLLGSVKWGILCNGYQWKLYDFSNPINGGVEVISFDLRSETDEIDLSKKAVEEVAWEFFDIHETNSVTSAWTDFSKEATAFSPESLAKAILSIDVVKVIAREIRGEHEYKANTEVLIDRIVSLIENGLDDSVPGWNEVKQLELYKFVKSQKRVGRKKKASPKETTATAPHDGPMETTERKPNSDSNHSTEEKRDVA